MERLWTDFANSLWHDWKGEGRSEDRLFASKWQQHFLVQHQYAAMPEPDTEERKRMTLLRDKLIETAFSLAGGSPLTAGEVKFYNETINGRPVFPQFHFSDDRLKLNYVRNVRCWDDILADVTVDFAKTVITGDTSRIRICSNNNCRWIFYDDTKSRRQRYCDDKLCGNLMKVRRFRAKKKEKTTEE